MIDIDVMSYVLKLQMVFLNHDQSSSTNNKTGVRLSRKNATKIGDKFLSHFLAIPSSTLIQKCICLRCYTVIMEIGGQEVLG